jgi:hypothetical protein
VLDGEIETTVIFHLVEDVLTATGLVPARLDKFELTNLDPRIILDAA